MKLKFGLLSGLLLLQLLVHSQLYKLSGTILNERNEPLPLASVEVKELKKGSVSRDDGTYVFFLERGKYDIVVSMVGYKVRVVTVYINNEDVTENIRLEDDVTTNLSEVVIKVKARDRAEEIVRNVIAGKDTVLAAAGAYSCNLYIRAFREDSVISKKDRDIVDTTGTGRFRDMSMAEISLRFDTDNDGKTREERLGVSKRGSTESLFYLSTTEGDFNIYNNLIKSPAVSGIPFVSPVSYSGLVAYRFKTLHIDRTRRPRVYTIAVRPRLLSNATVEGELVIEDSTWAILEATFRLPSGHLPEYDYFEVKQVFSRVNDTARMITRQQFNYYTKIKGGRRYGETTVLYSDFTFRKQFRKGYFGNEVSATAVEAYEKDSLFWKSVRREPLPVQQELYARYQDSIYRYMRSGAYLDSMDRVLNKITWPKVLVFGQIFNDHKKERMWILPPVTALIQPIAFGGARLKLAAAYRKTYPNRKTLGLDMDLSYGFRNSDVNGMIGVKRLYNPFTRGIFSLKASRNFEFIYPGDAWVNVLKRSNIYLNTAFEADHQRELVNGLTLMTTLEVAFRRSVSGYKVGNNADSLFGIPNEPPLEFDPYNATYGQVKLYYTPKLRYIRDAREKINLGSRWPTFYVIWRKGIPDLFRSRINFDYLEFGMEQEINLGVAGNTSYRVKTGDFPNTRDLRVIDYRFMRQGDPLFFQNPQKSLQALDSTFPVFERYYQGNLVHEFNGFFINRVPFLKKLKLQEVAGGGFLITHERDLRYFEFFAGIERVFKWPFNPLARVKLGVYVVSSLANKFNNPVQVKIGLTTWDRFRNAWR